MTHKDRARAYFTAVSNYDVEAIERMVDENYIQHNPFVPTGRAAFLALIPKLKAHGSKIKNIRILEDGQHVIMHHQWQNAAPFGHEKMAAFHIIRFDERSLIAEHWNIMTKDAGDVSLTEGPTQIEDQHLTEKHKELIAEQLRHFESPHLAYRKLHKIFGEGNFTLSIAEAISDGVLSAVYDLFRLEKEKVANHWRIVQEIPTKNLANHNTMFGF